MRNPRPVPQAGQNFQDAVGRWLCSQGQVVLNDRHRRGEPPLSPESRSAVEWLTASLTTIALVEFDADFTPTGDRGTRAEKRLDRERLLDDMPGRARWVLQHWDRRKVEGRQQGGRNSRRGPKWYPGVLSLWEGLPEAERRARAEAYGISRSTYYALRPVFEDYRAHRPAFDDTGLWELIGLQAPVGILDR